MSKNGGKENDETDVNISTQQQKVHQDLVECPQNNKQNFLNQFNTELDSKKMTEKLWGNDDDETETGIEENKNLPAKT